MQRRDFLKLFALGGLSQLPLSRLINTASAAEANNPSRYWIFIWANGGWDPTSFCDPKPKENNGHNWYSRSEIRTDLCRFPVAPYFQASDDKTTPQQWDALWGRLGNRALVINGINQQTNVHFTGSNVVLTGQRRPGCPNFGALVGAVKGRGLSLPYIGNTHNETRGIVSVSRLGAKSTFDSTVINIAKPSTVNPAAATNALYISDNDLNLINAVQRGRLNQLASDPKSISRRDVESLLDARYGSSANFDEFIQTVQNLQLTADSARDQGKIALAAFKSGLGVAADIAIGSFDTHTDHNIRHYFQVYNLFSVVEDILNQSRDLGIQDKLNVVVGSDFGRTPGYNATNGKDHWQYTSMMFFGADFESKAKVIGATDDGHVALKIDPATLKPVSDGGIYIKPEHVHLQLRKLANLDQDDLAKHFGIDGEDIPLFD